MKGLPERPNYMMPWDVVGSPDPSLVELWFVPSDGRAEQRWLGPSPRAERFPGYGAQKMLDTLSVQMRMGAGSLELREVA